MFSKRIAVGALLALACITGAAGGAYFGGRHDGPGSSAAAASVQPASEAAPATEETEAVISPAGTAGASPAVAVETTPAAPVALEAERPKASAPIARGKKGAPEPSVRPEPAARPSSAAAPRSATAPAYNPSPAAAPAPSPEAAPVRTEPATAAEPARVEPPRADPPPPAREFVELEVPSTSVIGLRIETPVSTDTAHLEDRVEARVMRDVSVDGRTAIPAGTKALGAVTMVERGGKVKERARLGVRFHTLVLADGSQLPIRSDTIIREGESPAGDSARKIGGAAVGGAILGALMGGKKGAIVGSTAGAAGGTAVVMAGDRNAATLPAGAVVTVRLSSPVSVEVEKK
jgi:hypothetical protein